MCKWIGFLLTKDISARLDAIEERQMTDEKDRIRYEVLYFANTCRNGRRHTRDEFLHIIELHDKYKELLKKTGDTNGVFTAEYRYILDLFREGSFLS